jgi:AAA+ ATPase superfamily predicted ATPase
MAATLEILKVKTPDSTGAKFKNLHKILLKPPFLGVINGSVRTGKSTILMNMIYNKDFYKNMFDKIIFISPTVLNDKTLKHLSEDDDIVKIYDHLDNIDSILKSIVDTKMENDKDDTTEDDWLIILDDMLGYIKPKGYVSYLCTRYRHSKISLIFTTQLFRSIPNGIRTNASFYLIFKTNNQKEYNKYDDEFGNVFPHFKELYNEACEKPYNFLYLDMRDVKAYHNFDQLLYAA